MENSTMSKDVKPAKPVEVKGCACKNKVSELQDQVSYLVSTLQEHADEFKAQRDVVERIRSRMGL